MQGIGSLLKMSNEILRTHLSARTIHVEIMVAIITKFYPLFVRRSDHVDAYLYQTN